MIKQIRYDDLNFYQKTVQTECMAVKMECLWNSDDVYCYLDKNVFWNTYLHCKNTDLSR